MCFPYKKLCYVPIFGVVTRTLPQHDGFSHTMMHGFQLPTISTHSFNAIPHIFSFKFDNESLIILNQ